jgi:predicted nucleic acid-binding protein
MSLRIWVRKSASVTGMTPEIALLDANVLYSAPLRDVLLQLSFIGLYQVRWSAEIADEWKRNLLAARPELTMQIGRTQAVMHRAIPDALVTGYASLIPDLVLPDPDDRHVLAAAIRAKAGVIVTFNLRDFPAAVLALYGIEAQHPDAFLKSFTDLEPLQVLTGVRECFGRLTRPSMSVATYLNNLRVIGLAETATFLDGKLP